MRKGKALNVIRKSNNAKEDPIGHSIVMKMILLALLPPEYFTDGLNHIQSLVNKHFKYSKKWKSFLKYFRNEWVKRVTPETFNVASSVDRTNNFVESYHRTLNMMLKKNPRLKDFFGKIKLLNILINNT